MTELSYSSSRFHMHECPKCHVTWAHDPRVICRNAGFVANNADDIDFAYDTDKDVRTQYTASHVCPECGKKGVTLCADPDGRSPDLFWDGETKTTWENRP